MAFIIKKEQDNDKVLCRNCKAPYPRTTVGDRQLAEAAATKHKAHHIEGKPFPWHGREPKPVQKWPTIKQLQAPTGAASKKKQVHFEGEGQASGVQQTSPEEGDWQQSPEEAAAKGLVDRWQGQCDDAKKHNDEEHSAFCDKKLVAARAVWHKFWTADRHHGRCEKVMEKQQKKLDKCEEEKEVLRLESEQLQKAMQATQLAQGALEQKMADIKAETAKLEEEKKRWKEEATIAPTTAAPDPAPVPEAITGLLARAAAAPDQDHGKNLDLLKDVAAHLASTQQQAAPKTPAAEKPDADMEGAGQDSPDQQEKRKQHDEVATHHILEALGKAGIVVAAGAGDVIQQVLADESEAKRAKRG